MNKNVLFAKNVEFEFDIIKEEIEAASEKTAIYVGADSKQFRKDKVDYVAYVTVIVLHFDSSAGGKIFKSVNIQRDYGSLRQRLMQEVYMAQMAAMEIVDSIEDRPFEIHLDLNPNENHKSSVCIKEAVGYIMGTMGFKPKVKPEAFTASTISDKFAVSTASKLKSR